MVCEKVVDAAGLKTIFRMFMKKQDAATTEHLLNIFAALLRSLPAASAARIRTLAKFMEKDYEKITKLVTLRREFVRRVEVVDAQIKEEKRGLSKEAVDSRVDIWFAQRLDGGLFSLQLVDVILAWLVAEDDGAKTAIVVALAERDETLGDIKKTLQEQLSEIDAVTGDGSEQANLREMLDTLAGFLV
jgi:beta-catenin-like protein 1